MNYEYPEFTKAMKKTHTILLTEMLEYHFTILCAAFKSCGYNVEVLSSKMQCVKDLGLKYTHNDICYPAILIIGQILEALKSKRYDNDKIAFMIPQAGGSCRAGNYYHLIRKALNNAGYQNIPVISLNIGGKEKNRGFKISIKLIRNARIAVCYGDLLMSLYQQLSPYEITSGECKQLVKKWEKIISNEIYINKRLKKSDILSNYHKIINDFITVPIKAERKKPKVGITGELYIKFCELATDNLEEFLLKNGCQVCMNGFISYAIYVVNSKIDEFKLNSTKKIIPFLLHKIQLHFEKCQNELINIMKEYNSIEPVASYNTIKACNKGILEYDCNTGDGWLVCAEAVNLIENNCKIILIVHPFGCLVSHVCERGIVSPLKALYPNISIQPIGYDCGISEAVISSRILLAISHECNKN